MSTFSAAAEDGSQVIYRDKKRHLYWLILISPMVSLLSIWLYFALGKNPLATLIPAMFFYAFTPIMDFIMGEDPHNPPEEVVNIMAADNYYRFIVHALVYVAIAVFLAFTVFVGTQDLPWWAVAALIIGVGSNSGGVMVMTHELGHKSNKLDRLSAKIGNMIMGYGHFNIEHNMGHHKWVATPEDPASSRMGENFYAFMLRELTGTFKRGTDFERQRLVAQGRSFWSPRNDVLQVYAVTLGLAAVFALLFGPAILLFLIPHHFLAWLALTQANYVEHYGLMREKLPNGRYERCQPKHSWNTNHTYSNLLSFHLQRHSDHHAYPLRPYQVLRDYKDVPALPTGYGGCFAMAFFPPLWFKVMDKKVIDWAGGDLSKVNIHPPARARLQARWGKGRLTAA
jgi:alkane 1-monooxygenase